MIGVGITTMNRPDFCEKSIKALLRQCGIIVDRVAVYNDGSDRKHKGAYARAFRPLTDHPNALVMDVSDNSGVAIAKNSLIEHLLGEGCDDVFILEDDIKITSPEAVTRYLDVAKANTLHHLSFAHHGPANLGGPVDVAGDVAFYPHSIGAWCYYSREFLLNVGLFDEHMLNAMEHVELELRAYIEGYAPGGGPHRFADAVGSEGWLTELPGAIEKSSIRPRPDWQRNIHDSMKYWRDNKSETYSLLFGSGTPLEAYAKSIIGE